VRAAISILKPIDALSFNDETKYHTAELDREVFCIPISGVHVDSSDESPECYVLKEIYRVFISLSVFVELYECGRESYTQA
jgi:hypothetical protein